VTGSTVRTTKAFASDLRDLLAACSQDDGLVLNLRARHADGVAVIEADGSWRSGIYVGRVGRIFVTGASQLLVGTRALLGEGWDPPSANTLIDLTSVTTPTSVQQLRGRILRLDPAWPDKTAHAYDVVCLDQSLDRGGIEFRRLVRRHDRTWGIVPGGDHAGDVVRGLDHVDPGVGRDLRRAARAEEAVALATAGLRQPRQPWQRLDLDAAIRIMAAIPERASVRALWRVGEPYDNAVEWFSRLTVIATDFRTVATIQDTLRALLLRMTAIVFAGLGSGIFWGQITGSPTVIPLGIIVGLLAAGLLNARSVTRLVRALLLDQPPDAIVGDAARAVLGALRRANVVSGRLTNEMLAVDRSQTGQCPWQSATVQQAKTQRPSHARSMSCSVQSSRRGT